MKGYMYILKCSNGSYYTGSTIDLEKRVANIRKVKELCIQEVVDQISDTLRTSLKKELKNARMKPEVHHMGSLYLGFGHEGDNLITLFGNAGVPATPHGMMHDLIDQQDISKYLNTSNPITLDNSSLRKHFSDEKLKVLIGTLLTDGKLSYSETDLNIKK